MTADGKGLICMSTEGGEKDASVLERGCWYECEPQMFGTMRDAWEVKVNAGQAPADLCIIANP